MRNILLLFIRFYKKYISPYKGFCCAYHFHTGRASCSTLGFRAIRRHGAWAGIVILRQRMIRCGQIYHLHTPLQRRPAIAQRGDCDCDLPGDISFDDVCDCLNCCNGCDWPRRKQKSANTLQKKSRWRRQ
ncbi:membrane protein insertion efficiency factor YidD [Iodobacter sp. HSC-16F04]|uniref:Membrane protein insertion efficiency factor YidD n=1 Tax=Iodobacter violaceini TaxID=3044271 RepID=A0ABX0KT85_9NEIS|nr:membrane protein insertion efficiency factor YidD [Iodobacter violacea]